MADHSFQWRGCCVAWVGVRRVAVPRYLYEGIQDVLGEGRRKACRLPNGDLLKKRIRRQRVIPGVVKAGSVLRALRALCLLAHTGA
jgi:hypothetical protein